MVTIAFTVHTIVLVPQNITANVGGEEINAIVDALEVELRSDHYGVLRLRFTGSERAAAEEIFVKDSVHYWEV